MRKPDTIIPNNLTMPADCLSSKRTTPSISTTAAHGGNHMTGSALHYRYTPLQQEIICAEAAIAALPATVDALGARRAMITCGPTILRACNVVPRVQEALGVRSAGVYAGVAPHAPVATVEEGVAMAKEVQPDVLISVGGGSTHDT